MQTSCCHVPAEVFAVLSVITAASAAAGPKPVSLSRPLPGPAPDGSDGRSPSDGCPAHDVQPARSQTHQPLHAHARSPGRCSTALSPLQDGCRADVSHSPAHSFFNLSFSHDTLKLNPAPESDSAFFLPWSLKYAWWPCTSEDHR